MGRVNQAGQGLPIQMDQQANSDSAQRAKTKSRLPPPSKVSSCLFFTVSLDVNLAIAKLLIYKSVLLL